MATSAPLRLEGELVRAAGAAARLHRRSLPRQIEYWAELGRAVERAVSAEDLLALREGLARLRVERGASRAVDTRDVLAEVEAIRVEGTFADRVAEPGARYQASPSHPGLLERIDARGRRATGRFEGGVFTPVSKR